MNKKENISSLNDIFILDDALWGMYISFSGIVYERMMVTGYNKLDNVI